MKQIRAFVGHSFRGRDSSVVDAFLRFFDQLKGSIAHFDWDHAYAAEPKDLAAKVLAIIADKNVFIGICTKNEVAADENSYQRVVLSNKKIKIARDALQHKTSDWIIQEIGLAKGRDMEIVLLVEEGLRSPGGLLGNIEYIPFNRDNPEKSFGKVVEMITALSPKQLSASTSVEPSDSNVSEQEEPRIGGDRLVPRPEWKTRDYRRAMFDAIWLDDQDALHAIDEAFQQSPANTGADIIPSWQGDIEYWKIVFGKKGSLKTLKSLVDAHPKNAELAANLAAALAHYDEHVEAAKMYLSAASLATDSGDSNKWKARAAVQFAIAQEFDNAEALIAQLKSSVGANEVDEEELLATILKLSDLRKDEAAQIAVMERTIGRSPDDTSTRFNLAHKYSELGDDEMTLYHYLKIPFERRTSYDWNNLGVAYDRFSLPYNAVEAWRMAENIGETLAMANLAQKFMEAGFQREAEEKFSKARAIDGYHKSVDTGLAQLKVIPDDEAKNLEEIKEKVKRKAEFYKSLGVAIAAPNARILPGRWRGRECVLDVSVSGDVFRATGSYEVTGSALGFAFLGTAVPTTKYQIEYECKIVGRFISGSVRRNQIGEAFNSLLSSLGDGKKRVLMLLSDDGGKLEILEDPHSAYASFDSLTAILS